MEFIVREENRRKFYLKLQVILSLLTFIKAPNVPTELSYLLNSGSEDWLSYMDVYWTRCKIGAMLIINTEGIP